MDDMKKLIEEFPSQLESSLEIAQHVELKQSEKEIRNVLITGLGGSGIGGKIVAQLVAGEGSVPILTNNDYAIPSFVDHHTLVIACSYSGNTEETLSALEEAVVNNAEIACITSNGKVEKIAGEKGLNCVKIPGGYPPRAALGYSLVQQFKLLHHYGVIPDYYEHELNTAIKMLELEQKTIREEAEKLAKQLHGKTPVIYAEAGFEGVVVRFRQQLNENSKMLCWHHVLPEMNHNELVGWAGGSDDLAVVLFRNEDDHSRTQTRMGISQDIFKEYTSSITEIWSKGTTRLEKSIYLIHLGDWTSLFLAQAKGIDPVEVKVIDFLKGELAKQ